MKRNLRFLPMAVLLVLTISPVRVQAGKSLEKPKIIYDKKVSNKTQKVKLKTSVKKGVIYYTTDGSTPVKGSSGTKKYKKKIKVKKTTTIKCRVYKGKKKSKVASVKLIILRPVTIKKIALAEYGVSLKWKKSKNAEGYRVYRKKTKDGEWECIKKIKDKGTTTYLDEDVDWKSKYYYYISAYRGKCKSRHKDNTKSISTKHDHSYEDGKVLMEATCEKKGKKEQVCSVCGKTKTVKTAKLPHETERRTEGIYTLEICRRCGKQIRKYLEEDIPDYWNDEITGALERVRAREDLPGFVFFTDTHWEKNTGHSPAMINYVTEELGYSFAAFGGDAITAYHTSPEDAREELRDFYSGFRVPVFSTTGNHDWNSSSNPDESTWLSEAEVYDLMYREESGFANVEGGVKYSYLDDEAHRIRYISFYYDERYPVEQEVLGWIRRRVAELPEDWNVVLFSHAYWTYREVGSDPVPLAEGEELANELLSIQRDSEACIALWLVGHIHRDLSELLGDETCSIRVVSTNCDAYKLSKKWGGRKMKKGTATEQVIDLVQLDTGQQKIYLTRIGAGKDREYSWLRPARPEEPETTQEESETTLEETPPAAEETTREETPQVEETSTEETTIEETP